MIGVGLTKAFSQEQNSFFSLGWRNNKYLYGWSVSFSVWELHLSMDRDHVTISFPRMKDFKFPCARGRGQSPNGSHPASVCCSCLISLPFYWNSFLSWPHFPPFLKALFYCESNICAARSKCWCVWVILLLFIIVVLGPSFLSSVPSPRPFWSSQLFFVSRSRRQ